MAMATRDVEKENAVQNEASPRVAGPVSGGSGGRKRTTGCAAASPGPAACAATDEEPKGADGSGGGSAQPEGVSMEGLPSWCDRPLVTREHFPEDAVVDAFCLLPGHPLLALAAEGQAPLLGKVLENGGDPDARDSRGYTVLLEAGASLQVVDAAGRTAGELAQAAGHADVADMLRQHEEVQRALREQRLKQLEHSQEQAEMVDAAC
ncbi:hypothetical protein CHLNCDRAFT_135658 [Chlorella variabilis]|uniref:Uncharacterized protein n=1 Tax=Chlorella variabilis TaxID=554065 RepID=E1ZIP6_CHLVA|nr:hypothetical protein CHLNCDRAFT_135658 [Chlorella variabilis]EFN54371.1 hypothetical protein CHLNCDRAFT_135658 [Chlorella variabilis]|eukprot:XP_005846473.1 hypothetical protein CHLNCDRAFT_135658 [Chlorella variabilis]